MPLHLLPKKSWNVYNPANIARVKADEAAAEARSEAEDQRLRDYEAEQRLAILRGEEPPEPPPDPSLPAESEGQDSRKRDRRAEGDEKRKRRRLAGEDDTDRDIRVARQEEESRHQRAERGLEQRAEKRKRDDDEAPVMDQRGHIQLFAPPSTRQIRKGREEEVARAKREKFERERGKEGEGGDGGMRFVHAAGRGRKKGEVPWYASGGGGGFTGTEELDKSNTVGDFGEGREVVLKNAFGMEDPDRWRRDEKRISQADPMAVMRKAQGQLKDVERRRNETNEERQRELEVLRREQDREDRKRERRRRREDEDLEGFSLDAPVDGHTRRSDRDRRHSHHSRRDSSRGMERDGDHRSHHHRHRSHPRSDSGYSQQAAEPRYEF